MQMTKEEIRDKYNRAENKKATLRLLAELEGTDEATIRRILEEKQEPEPEVRTDGELPKKKLLTQKERAAIIRAMLSAGKPVNQIAEEAGCSEQTVLSHAKKLKLEAVAAAERQEPVEVAMPTENNARRVEQMPGERVTSILLAMPADADNESKLMCYELCRSILQNAER